MSPRIYTIREVMTLKGDSGLSQRERLGRDLDSFMQAEGFEKKPPMGINIEGHGHNYDRKKVPFPRAGEGIILKYDSPDTTFLADHLRQEDEDNEIYNKALFTVSSVDGDRALNLLKGVRSIYEKMGFRFVSHI